MAHGTIYPTNPSFIHVALVDGATGTTDGVWVDIGGFRRDLAIHVDGITAATVAIAGDSTGSTSPADSDNGDQVGANITADGHYTISQSPRWIKARVTAYSSGTISVTLLATRT